MAPNPPGQGVARGCRRKDWPNGLSVARAVPECSVAAGWTFSKQLCFGCEALDGISGIASQLRSTARFIPAPYSARAAVIAKQKRAVDRFDVDATTRLDDSGDLDDVAIDHLPNASRARRQRMSKLLESSGIDT